VDLQDDRAGHWANVASALMSPDIAAQLGKATPGRAAPIRCPREVGIFALAAYLEREDARIRDVGMR
jgi:hypothetical protein